MRASLNFWNWIDHFLALHAAYYVIKFVSWMATLGIGNRHCDARMGISP